jgi:hypothetical protein
MIQAPDFGPLPPRIARLPVEQGWPVPWFVDWREDGQGVSRPDFRVVDKRKFFQAIKERRCWVCGDLLGHWLAFPIGPMCSITRTISEPPSHRECAEWSIQNCPFLSNPAMVRRTDNLPDDAEQAAGAGLTRNPGVMCLWMTRTFETFRVAKTQVGNEGTLITVGEPADVTWWCEGRRATRAEVKASVESGFPSLLNVAKLQGKFAVEELGKQTKRAEALWPPT